MGEKKERIRSLETEMTRLVGDMAALKQQAKGAPVVRLAIYQLERIQPPEGMPESDRVIWSGAIAEALGVVRALAAAASGPGLEGFRDS